jgi:hypothetical protein
MQKQTSTTLACFAVWLAGGLLSGADLRAAAPATAHGFGGACCAQPCCCENCCCCEEACCDCEACCGAFPACNMCPCTYAWAEALIVWRDNQAGDQPLVIEDPFGTADVLLRVGDLDFDSTGGVRAGVGFRTCCGPAWEFGYLGIFDHSASAVVAREDVLFLPGDLGLVVNNFGQADRVTAHYASDLHSFEVNLVCCCCDCDCCGHCCSTEWFGGFRFLALDEDFSLTAVDSEEGTSVYRVETRNHLWGAQVGARVRRCCCGWSWEATGKLGLFANHAEQSQDPIIDFLDVERRSAQSGSDSELAFVGDFNLSAIYHLTTTLGIRVGYNLLWIDGVALAPDQLDFTNQPNSGTNLVGGGAIVVHGVNVGLEGRW